MASNKARIHQRARRDHGRSPHVRRRVPRASGDRSRHGVLSAPHNGRFGTLVCDLPQGWPTDGCSPACGRLSNGRTAMSPGVTRVISTEANALVAPIHIHNRIPVVLEEEDWPIWLGGQPGDLLALLHAPVADVLHCQLIRRKGRRADNRRGCGPVGDQGVAKEPSPDRAVALCFPA